jgi:hypothetical protein
MTSPETKKSFTSPLEPAILLS